MSGKLTVIESLDGRGKATQSKLPREDWYGYNNWLFGFEFQLMGIPAPDKVIYLKVDPAVSRKLMTKRYQDDESMKDLHESNLEYLEKFRLAAECCANKLGWETIPCDDGVNMRSIEQIHEDVAKLAFCG